jgi:hypothetical protein
MFRLLGLLGLFGGSKPAQVIFLKGGGQMDLEEALAASPLVGSHEARCKAMAGKTEALVDATLPTTTGGTNVLFCEERGRAAPG